MTAFCDVVYGPSKARPKPNQACQRLMAETRKCIDQIQGDSEVYPPPHISQQGRSWTEPGSCWSLPPSQDAVCVGCGGGPPYFTPTASFANTPTPPT